MRLIRAIARSLLRLGGWTAVGGQVDVPKAVIIAYPHTSNWDGLWALTYKVAVGLVGGMGDINPSIEVGTKAPTFELVDQDGKKHSSDAYAGKIMMLDWWGVW